MPYKFIIAKKHGESGSGTKIKVQDKSQENNESETADDVTFCEVCAQSNREDRMLLCDGCDNGYHCECLNPPVHTIPEGSWYCPNCARANGRGRATATRGRANNRNEASVRRARSFIIGDDEEEEIDLDELNDLLSEVQPTTSRLRQTNDFIRPIARTTFSERVRRNVNANRIQRGSYIVVSESEEDSDELDDELDEGDTEEDEEEDENSFDENSDEEEVDEQDVEQELIIRTRPVAKKAKTTKIKRRRKKRKTTKKRKSTSKKTTGTTKKPKKRKRRTKKRRLVKKKKVTSESVQNRILNKIQKAQQSQLEKDKNPTTLVSIVEETGQMMERGNKRFPLKKTPTWFAANNFYHEIDE